LLSRAQRRVVAFNVPMTYPPRPVNGVMLSGLPTPSTQVEFTYPASLYQEIVDEIGEYILYPDPGQAYSDSGIDAFLKRLYRCTELRTQTLDYLRRRENPDLCMVVYNGTDTISHALWKFMDRTHPLYDANGYAKYGHAMRDFFKTVDGHLAGIVDGLEDETTLIVMSDHGFGPFHKFIHVNNWLIDRGFMRIKRGPLARTKHALFRLGFSPMNVYDKLMALGFGRLKREVVRGQGQGLLKTLFLSFEDVDWSRTVAYAMGNVGQIYLNVAGREPHGIVSEAEYEPTRERIIAELRELRDPATGEQVVEHIYRREELYSGPQLENAPDIVFLPTRLEYFGFGEYEFGSHQIIESMKRGISGTHRPNGIFIAYGKSIRPGAWVENAGLADLAPTILHLMGYAAPAHMDGRVLHEALDPAFRPELVAIDDDAAADGPDAALTEEQTRTIAERLRGLGYVG
jgi:predicted AlkP superfamily phosphohydrolase/phosphomutase